MPEALDVPPTRSALLQLHRELEQLRQGYDLLERKREVLVRELLALIADAEATEAEVRRRFRAAYEALQEARMRMGEERLQWVSLAPAAEIHTEVTLRSVMGVAVPQVRIDVKPLPLPYSLGDTSVAVDEARERWLEVAQHLGHLAEVVTAVWRLTTELQKTQRRVNALQHILIPRYEAAIRRIGEMLEEQEREAFVHAREVKALRVEEQR